MQHIDKQFQTEYSIFLNSKFMTMRKTNLILIFTLIVLLFGLNSCIEEEESVDYTILNKSDYNIKIVKYGGYDYNFRNGDTMLLNRESQIIFHYSGKGGTSPFLSIDSLGFFSGDKLKHIYKNYMPGKSPFNLDYYSGGKTDYKHHITYSQYTYIIENIDFDAK